MPKFKVTVEARKVADVDQTVEVEARNATQAGKIVQAMIDNDEIKKKNYEEVFEWDITDERVGSVEKIS
jgi:hypothetical protein